MKGRRKNVIVGTLLWFLYFELIVMLPIKIFTNDIKIFLLGQVVVLFMTAVIIAATFGNQNKDYEN